jgi:regulator of cell morphogenesis and NO signaling
MIITPATKVRDVALQLPQSTRVFERLKIDYCCGGDQSVNQACVTAGIGLDALMKLIEQVDKPPTPGSASFDSQSATLSELIGYILEKHHVYTKEEIARLGPLTEKVIGAHGANHPELLSIRDLLRQLCAELLAHMFKEEQILFPFVIQLEESVLQNRPAPFPAFGTVNNPIRMMMREHDNAGEILRELRKLSCDFRIPDNACVSYKTFYEALQSLEQDLHQHIHLENNILFPKAVAMEAGS